MGEGRKVRRACLPAVGGGEEDGGGASVELVVRARVASVCSCVRSFVYSCPAAWSCWLWCSNQAGLQSSLSIQSTVPRARLPWWRPLPRAQPGRRATRPRSEGPKSVPAKYDPNTSPDLLSRARFESTPILASDFLAP